MGLRESITTQSGTATLAASVEVDDWRGRLRLAAYALYRRLDERSPAPVEAEVEKLVGLIDQGRVEPGSPPTLTRVTAEALGGAISQELWLASRRKGSPPEAELVPMLMYAAVLPYAGEERAVEELRIPPPPR